MAESTVDISPKTSINNFLPLQNTNKQTNKHKQNINIKNLNQQLIIRQKVVNLKFEETYMQMEKKSHLPPTKPICQSLSNTPSENKNLFLIKQLNLANFIPPLSRWSCDRIFTQETKPA